MVEVARVVLVVLDAIVVTYFSLYLVVNFTLFVLSLFTVRKSLYMAQLYREGGTFRKDEALFSPLISLLVPAYNEEVSIVESVRSLLRLDYPQYEIIIVNDGSKDATVEVLKKTFSMVRSKVDYQPHLATSPIRCFYRGTVELPEQVRRLVLVDKDNGGKADALNAGINASQGVYVASMDADSLMIGSALRQVVRPILDDPNRVVACGGQVALSNGSRVVGGQVVELRLPPRWIARFQVVEYMRSFTQARTGLANLNALLILSGVFAVFHRELLVATGGFLTKHMRSKVGTEYCGRGSETVCEDMEVVVRMHRYLYDHGMPGEITLLPFPTSWTEAPEVWRDLGKQRNRWYRGLLEVIWIHRGMLFRPRYGRIGLFSLPYQLFFEALAPLIELMGYLVVPLSWLAGLLDTAALLAFGAFALACNLLLSFCSLSLSLWKVRLGRGRTEMALFDYRGAKALVLLTLAALLSNLGYRQYLLYWQLRGLRDFLAGRKSWDKFARRGFQSPA